MTPQEELDAIKEARALVDRAQAERADAWKRLQRGDTMARADHDAAVEVVQRHQAALDRLTRNMR